MTVHKGDQFIIEIDDVVRTSAGLLYKIKGFNTLVFDDYGIQQLIRLKDRERWDQAMTFAYTKGQADAVKHLSDAMAEIIKD